MAWFTIKNMTSVEQVNSTLWLSVHACGETYIACQGMQSTSKVRYQYAYFLAKLECRKTLPARAKGTFKDD